jgi:RNA polymerase sigma-70 factor, ECF subfamily
MTTRVVSGHRAAMSLANPPLPMDSCEDGVLTRAKEVGGHVMRFYSVYRDQVDYVWRLAFLLGIPRTDVDDAVQEVFLVVHRRLDQFPPPGPPRPWIRSVTLHVCRNHQRWKRRLRRWFIDGDNDWDHVSGAAVRGDDAAFARYEDLAALDCALRRLSSKQREVFIMAELEQLTAAEIGELLTISPNTAASRLRAARQSINEFVACELNGNGDSP